MKCSHRCFVVALLLAKVTIASERGVELEVTADEAVRSIEDIDRGLTAGRHGVRVGDDHWAIYSMDGSLAAHFEFTIAITAEGPRILTPWHEAGGGRRAAA